METVLQIKVLKENINRNDIEIKNLLKDVWECETDIRALNQLNLDISKRINQTRQDLADLKRLIETIEDNDMLSTLKTQFDSMQNQFEVNMVVLQKAVISSQRKINQKTRDQLFKFSNELRNRFDSSEESRANEELIANKVASLTDNLQAVNRSLANEVERSMRNLDTLVTSSAIVTETSEEFKTMSSYIGNSKTLLNKYGRRELTDKVLIGLAMAFFFACVMYVVMRRLYWK